MTKKPNICEFTANKCTCRVTGIGLFTYHKYRKSVGTPEPFERLGARHQEDGVSAFSLGELELDEHESTSLDAPREVNHPKKQVSEFWTETLEC